MKWTMLSVALMGIATYAVIFLSHLSQEPVAGEDAATDVLPFEAGDTDPTQLATLPQVPVSEVREADVIEEPRWTGDAWTAGVEAFGQGRDELAVDALKAAVAEREDSSYRHYLLALALRRTGQIDDAVIELERSLELSPAASKTWSALARCELDRDETAAARVAVDAALELDLESADAWHLLGRVEMSEGTLEHAEAAFTKALEKDAEHAWAANNLGYARILQERFEAALAPLQAAVAIRGDEPVFFNNLGIALERSGHRELAALSFAHAVVLGHGPAEQNMERVEDLIGNGDTAFAAIDSVEFIGAPELAARVEQAVLVVTVDLDDEELGLIEPGLVAANETPESRD